MVTEGATGKLNVTVLSVLVDAVLGSLVPFTQTPAGIVAITVPLLVMPDTATL